MSHPFVCSIYRAKTLPFFKKKCVIISDYDDKSFFFFNLFLSLSYMVSVILKIVLGEKNLLAKKKRSLF